MTRIDIKSLSVDKLVPPNNFNPVDVEFHNEQGLPPAFWDSEHCAIHGAWATLKLYVNDTLIDSRQICATIGPCIGACQIETLMYSTPPSTHSIRVEVVNYDGKITDSSSTTVRVREGESVNGENGDEQALICIPFTDTCVSRNAALMMGGAGVVVLAAIASR